MKSNAAFVLLILFWCTIATGQVTINTCDDYFTDSGGQTGNYANGESYSTLICPDGSGGSHINLLLYPYDIASGDVLCFYDGVDASANLIFCTNNFPGNSEVIVRASATNLSGCIYTEFVSDGTETGDGWIAEISCVQSCQQVFSEITMTDPVVEPVDTGYIDICPGSTVSFSGRGIYPQSGMIYNQSDATSSFIWTFGDGSRAYGPVVQHLYSDPGGYFVNLEIIDGEGCKSTTIQQQRIRVSDKPSLTVSALPADLCAGDTLGLTASLSKNSGANVVIETKELSFPLGKTLSDTLFLPDGNQVSYSTSLLFTDFKSGATVTDGTDVESICLSIEHSYSGDLDIKIHCPNGQEVSLLRQGSLGSENLGEPMASSMVDGVSSDDTPGIPYDYCFTEISPDFSRMIDVNAPTYNYTTVPDEMGMRYTYQDKYFESGSYTPQESLAGLIGCPLNGEWTIEVIDNLSQDNGWIFEWGINFKEDLFRRVEKFEPSIANYEWNPQNDILTNNVTDIEASPEDAGFARFSIDIMDEFGCNYDTNVVIPVLPVVHPDCYRCLEELNLQLDTTLCLGSAAQLDQPTLPNELVKFNTYPYASIGAATHSASSPLVSTNLIQEIFPESLSNENAQLIEVCLDLQTNITSDITAYLESPSGASLLLFQNIGGFDANFVNTCFRTDATNPIQSGTAPFTGSYLPMGNWQDLRGSTINGEWKLILSDAFGIQDVGVLESWSISFSHDYNWTYSWNHPDLSCTSCPDPVYTHNLVESSIYLNASNDLNCILQDSIHIDTKPDFEAVDLSCNFDTNGNITIRWDEPVGSEAVEISYTDDKGTFFDWGVASSMSQQFQDLKLGDSITFLARALPEDKEGYCASLVDSIVCRVGECSLENTYKTTDPVCNGGGRIEITSSNPIGGVDYTLSTGETNDTGIFEGLGAGQYDVIVEDDFGCMDTVRFSMASVVNGITIDVDTITPSCGGMDGQITLIVSGGTSPYMYSWSDDPTAMDSVRSNLEAGTYYVTVSDPVGCETIDTIDLYQIQNLFLDSIQIVQHVSCPGGRDGAARGFARGGTGPRITFLWSDPLATTSFDVRLLPAGVYTLTITDGIGCEQIDSIEITEPDTFLIDTTVIGNTCFGAFEGGITINDLSGGTEPYTFSWSGPNGFTSNMEDITGLESGDYILEVTDANNCMVTYDFTISEPPTALSISLMQTDTSCAGQNNSSISVSAMGGTGNFMFDWDGGPNTPNWMGVSDGWQFVEVTDGGMCIIRDSIFVVSFDSIRAQLSIVPPTCVGNDNGIIGVSQVSGGSGDGTLTDYTYQWDYQSIDSFAIVNGVGNRDYTVTIRDSRGCSADFTRFLPDGDSLMIELSTQDLDCANDSTGFVMVNNVVNANPPISYLWNTGDTTSELTNLGPGVYTVSVSDDTGCEAEASHEIVAVDSIVVASNVVRPKCDEQYGSIELLIFGGSDPYDIEWEDGSSALMRDSLERGTYLITVTDDNNCMVEKEVPLFTLTTLDSLILDVDSIDCFNSVSGSITIDPIGGTRPFEYSIDGGNTFVSFSFFPGLKSGMYDIIIRDADGCITQDSVTLTNPPQIEVTNISDTSMFFGDTLSLTPNVIGNQGGYEIQWESDSTGFMILNDSTAQFFPIQNSLYNFVVIDENGCEVEVSFKLLVDKNPRIFVPTGFTPDANTNNRLGILGETDVFIEEFKIFDRWGELMFEQNEFFVDNALQGWDGSFNGEKCQPGVYVWYAIFIYSDGLQYKVKGHTTLLR